MKPKEELLGKVDRRTILKTLGLVVGGITLTGLPIPSLGAIDEDVKDKTLRAFIETVTPGINGKHPDLTKPLYDKYYRFDRALSILVNDLNKKSREIYSRNYFSQLGIEEREKIIDRGLRSGLIKSKVYQGSIYLVQALVLTGSYNEENSCHLIDFKGEYNYEATTYPNQKSFLGESMTESGYLK